jgi:hypothetical protein
MGKGTLFLYLISHNRKDIKTHTYIGCVEDFVSRLHQHNGQISGGPRITKRAAGSWDPVIVLKLPNDRKFKSKAIKKEWKQSSRGLESRIRKGLILAVKYNLTCFIMKKNQRKIPLLKFLDDKWDGNKIKLDEEEWKSIIDN